MLSELKLHIKNWRLVPSNLCLDKLSALNLHNTSWALTYYFTGTVHREINAIKVQSFLQHTVIILCANACACMFLQLNIIYLYLALHCYR